MDLSGAAVPGQGPRTGSPAGFEGLKENGTIGPLYRPWLRRYWLGRGDVVGGIACLGWDEAAVDGWKAMAGGDGAGSWRRERGSSGERMHVQSGKGKTRRNKFVTVES